MTVEPRATYRLQLTPELGFGEAGDLLDHLARLHVSHVYLSPIAQAVPDSQHGYDVVDHTRVRAEFGGEAGFETLLDVVAERGMAVIVDHVPNHVASSRPDLNPHWWALLRDGRGSVADDWFDVDWSIADDRVILPVIGAPLDEVVADGHISVERDADVDGDGDGVLVLYGEHRYPIAAGTIDLPLDELLEHQHYRLQFWRRPDRNVRRFFSIDDLVAVRVEHPHVAELVDTLPARYASHPGFGGVRVDHVDGLADPLGYLRGLRERIGDDALLYVEKIVVPGETLPPSWPVDGTTGYEFARSVDHLMTARAALEPLEERWVENSGDDRPFHAWEAEAKREVVAGGLAPDLARVTRLAIDAVEGDEAAIADEVHRLATELPRYRTYLPDDPDAAALIGAMSDGPVAAAILSPGTPVQEALRTRWQQLTGPVMAKGAEDRSFYRYLRWAALCEVGGDPGRFGIDPAEFHADNLERQRDHPRAMLCASTHDTKRSEDVRAWAAAMTWRVVDPRYPLPSGEYASGRDWTAASRSWVRELVARTGVDAPAASLAVQTVISTPGLDVPRLIDFLTKAAREAALRTAWTEVDDDYEARLAELAELVVGNGHVPGLGLEAVGPAVSLASTTLRLTSPGVPDIYQGAEGWWFRLVDPDNRARPDWEHLRVAAADDRTVADLWAEAAREVKTVLVRTLLDLRRRRPLAFGPEGAYTPIDVGEGAIAYARGNDVVVVVRCGLAPVASSCVLPPGRWYDVFDPAAPTLGGTVATTSLVGSGPDGTLPVAVLERDD